MRIADSSPQGRSRRAARPPCSLPPSFKFQVSSFNPPGFTLIEVLVALLLSALVLGTVLTAQLTVGRAERDARMLEQIQPLMQRIHAQARLGRTEQEILAGLDGTWRVDTQTVAVEDGTNVVHWQEWTIRSATRPSLKVVFHVPAPSCTVAISENLSETVVETPRSSMVTP